jgi:hypothetical protein
LSQDKSYLTVFDVFSEWLSDADDVVPEKDPSDQFIEERSSNLLTVGNGKPNGILWST